MKKQVTAVEWLANELYEKMEMKGNGNVFDKILEKANKMFEKQIINARLSLDQSIHFEDALDKAEQYYNETFNNQN